jgi:hypothetical protein
MESEGHWLFGQDSTKEEPKEKKVNSCANCGASEHF